MHPMRRFSVFLLAAALTLTASACSNTPKPAQETGLTQVEADDLVQQLGALVATDLGGWMIEVTSTSTSIPLGTPTMLESVRSPIRVLRDTTLDPSAMHWRIHYTYQKTSADNDTSATWSDSTTAVNGLAFAKGTIAIPTFQGRTGTAVYGRDNSSFLATAIGTSADTTIAFDGFCNSDTALTTLVDGTSRRYYFVDNIVDYTDLEMRRQPGQPVYPVSGEVRVDVVADVLNNPTHDSTDDKDKTLDAVMVITFESAHPQNPALTITAATSNATAVYHYRLDLKTGIITRL